MLVEFYFLTSALIVVTKCSFVVDSVSQNGLYVTDFCPKMPHCAEGAHVMCMYYNPNSVMGPKCSDAQNITVTPEIAAKLLDISNAIRSKLALGKEKGAKGEYLPRGYGIFRLEWDNELATFAQVLANQCVLRHDLCRATKRFPDPGQTAGLVRFSYPDWFPISKASQFTVPGLSKDKLIYAAIQIMKSWYSHKNSVTPSMIDNYPDWSLNPNNQAGRLYLEMIYGSATHMGCGISAYTEYAHYDNHAPLNYNSIQIICNFSSRASKGGLVYNTTQPTAPGYTVACGCPPGSDEDEQCLCKENLIYSLPEEPKPAKVCSSDDLDCKEPTVVLLPIFTIEDAPQRKLIKPPVNNNTSRRKDDDSMEIFKQFEQYGENKDEIPLRSSNEKTRIRYDNQLSKNGISSTRNLNILPPKYIAETVQKELYMKESVDKEKDLNRYSQLPNLHNNVWRKPSIFAKAQQFRLPILKSSLKTNVNNKHDNLINNIIDKPNTHLNESIQSTHEHLINDGHFTNDHYVLFSQLNKVKDIDIKRTLRESTLNTAEEKIIKQENYLKKNGKNKESDNLLHLLDKLEKGIKTAELKDSEKMIIDAKIRKIYGTVIGHENSAQILEPKLNFEPKISTDKYLDHTYIHYKANEIEDVLKHPDKTDIAAHDDLKADFQDYITNNHETNLINMDNNERAHINNINDKGYHVLPNHHSNFENPHRDTLEQDSKFFKNNKGINRDTERLKNYYDTDFDNSHSNFQNNNGELETEKYLHENDDESKRLNYQDYVLCNHRNTKTINNKRYHKNRKYDHSAADEEDELKRSRELHNVYDDEVKHRNTFKPSNPDIRSHFRIGASRELKRRDEHVFSRDVIDDPLDLERRKYYQDKLDKIQRRNKNTRQYAHNRKRAGRPLRPMRPTDKVNARSKVSMDAPYIPENARFLHGF